MTVKLANIYEPLSFNARVDETSVRLNRFIASGVVVDDPTLAAQVSGGGRIGETPYYGPLGEDEPNYSTDDDTSSITPKGIASKKDIWRLANMNQAWGAMNLARELAMPDMDPLTAIADKVGKYWSIQKEKRLINSCLGVLADNVANDSSDMLVSVATDDVGAPAAAELLSGDLILQGKQTMGDHGELVDTIAMHSVCYTGLQQQNLIEYLRDADGNLLFPTYLNYRVVVEDSMPAVAGTNRITYTSALFGPGVFRRAPGRVDVPSEQYRAPLTGDGGGQDMIISRQAEVVYPGGFSFVSGSVAGQTATLAELLLAANWDRNVANRKSAVLAFLETNG